MQSASENGSGPAGRYIYVKVSDSSLYSIIVFFYVPILVYFSNI
jgi:hypothetical protein